MASRVSVVLFASAISSMGLTTAAPLAAAGELELPRRNPRARVCQRVGLTDITIDYDSPAVAGRRVAGGVVAYDQPWLTGDTPAPQITFSRDVTVGGKAVPAGSYALVMTPGRGDWTVAFNKSANLLRTDRGYRAELDVAQVKARATAAPHRERLAFTFADFTNDHVDVALEWETLRVAIPIGIHTSDQLVADIKALDDTWRAYANAARFMLEAKKDYDAGLKYVDQSLALGDHWYSLWIKSSLLAAKGRHQEARELASRAYQLGLESGDDFIAFEPAVRRAAGQSTENRALAAPAPALAGPAKAPGPLAVAVTPAPIEPTEPWPASIAPMASIASIGSIDSGGTPVALVGERGVRTQGAAPAKTPAPAVIAPIIRRRTGDIQTCYQRALRQDPTLTRGRLMVSVNVGLSGLVNKVVLDSPRPLRALEPCIKDSVSHWVFPLSPIEYGVEFPVVLQGK